MPLALLLFFWAVTLITVAFFIARTWWLPELVSVHGRAIDDQLVLTLVVAGIVFFLAQIALGYLIWKFRARANRTGYLLARKPQVRDDMDDRDAGLVCRSRHSGQPCLGELCAVEAPC